MPTEQSEYPRLIAACWVMQHVITQSQRMSNTTRGGDAVLVQILIVSFT